jgi:hypothetical protein
MSCLTRVVLQRRFHDDHTSRLCLGNWERPFRVVGLLLWLLTAWPTLSTLVSEDPRRIRFLILLTWALAAGGVFILAPVPLALVWTGSGLWLLILYPTLSDH